MMDDPVMILAVKEGVLEKLTPASVPNLAKIRPDAIHMDGMWANYLQPWQGIAYNVKALPGGVPTWADTYDPKFKGRLIIPSLQNTEGLANLVIAAHLETGKPMDKAQYEIDAAFKKIKTLKPNLLTVYTQLPQVDGALSPAGIDSLLAEARNALTPELRKTLVATAGELIDADGAEAGEKALLDKIRRTFG